ncbi:MAG: type II toxin-antitoxin system HicB family antitoxin [Alphaproteobacteria bacterium]|nr:type II toxin-antitoxin system HicB family antitoxin [Alphaproteobacteria bacterium]
MIDYPFTVRHLSKEEGGGYLAESLDLNGCMADGETIEEAVHNLEDAVNSWIKTAQELGHFIPSPSDDSKFSGKWVVRTPKSIHHRLVDMAKREGVSLNTLTVSLLAEGLGSKAIHHS